MKKCRLCSEEKVLQLINFGKHPIAHYFLSSPSQEEYRHPVVLCFCENCGHIQLEDPVPAKLLYTNYLCLSSWKHQPHIPRIIQIMEEFTDLSKSSNILDVGSNDGNFLEELSNRGYQNLVGIEPANDAQLAAKQRNITTIPLYFNKETAKVYQEKHGECNIFISRQMLEHVSDLSAFIEAMHMVIAKDSFVVFEVPNFKCNLDNFDYAVWEEHVNYFTSETLSWYLTKAGIKVIYIEPTIFSGEALIVVGRYIGRKKDVSLVGKDSLRKRVFEYRDSWPRFYNAFNDFLTSYTEQGKKIIAYGAGARLCSLLNFSGVGRYLECVVDDLPEKQGKYMPGSMLSILTREALNNNETVLCLLAVNTECEEKVIAKHSDFIKQGGSFVSVLPPSKRLPQFWNDLISNHSRIG